MLPAEDIDEPPLRSSRDRVSRTTKKVSSVPEYQKMRTSQSQDQEQSQDESEVQGGYFNSIPVQTNKKIGSALTHCFSFQQALNFAGDVGKKKKIEEKIEEDTNNFENKRVEKRKLVQKPKLFESQEMNVSSSDEKQAADSSSPQFSQPRESTKRESPSLASSDVISVDLEPKQEVEEKQTNHHFDGPQSVQFKQEKNKRNKLQASIPHTSC
jgi:hypothetical protein